MAFIDFHQVPAPGFALPRHDTVAAKTAPESLFSHLEAQVLALSRRDGVATLNRHPIIERMMRVLFGITRPNSLADPKLEALRRFAVIARLSGPRGTACELPRFRAYGFSEKQAFAVVSLAAITA